MKEILLSQGKVALVDNDEFERLNKFKWYAAKQGNSYYAIRIDYSSDSQKTIRMHREILNTPEGMDSDHIDGDGLNNLKENLRVVTRRQNMQNTHITKSSKYPGVCLIKRKKPLKNPWLAQIEIDGKNNYLGIFPTEEEARKAYLKAIPGTV